jgi:ribosomal-protein-alanine N-acetyltransferase
MKRAWLVGEKIYLRTIERADIDNGWLDWINDPVNTIGLLSPSPQTREHLVQYFEGQLDLAHVAMFAVCDKENDRYIGNARLFDINPVNRMCGYGRLIGPPEYRGKGYGSDALIQLLRHGFHNLGLNRIWSVAFIENERSLRSNRKIGMTEEGTARDYCYKNGNFYDGIYLSMLRRDFDRLHGDPDHWAARDAKLRAGAKGD